MVQPVGVGIVGGGWMGQVHARAYARLRHHYPDLPAAPRLVGVADPVESQRMALVERHDFEREYADWRDLLGNPDVAVVSVTTPTFLHAEVGEAAARAGKHVWVEKPVGLTPEETARVADAVQAAGVVGRVGFNYRLAPAVVRARSLIASGAIGTVTHARFRLLTDYAAHPGGVLSWRFEAERGGDGVVGDLLSHGVDLVRFLLGDIERVVADGSVFIPTRPIASGTGSHYEVATGGPQGRVGNLDHLGCLMRTVSGAAVHLEGSRVSVGDQNNYGFEVRGTRGLVAWDFRRMGELQLSAGDQYANQPVTTSYVGPGDGDFQRFQPGAGISMGYDDLKVIECADLFWSVVGEGGSGLAATTRDAVAASAVMAALRASATSGEWTEAPLPQAAG
jgi:predicted dehydrogenase